MEDVESAISVWQRRGLAHRTKLVAKVDIGNHNESKAGRAEEEVHENLQGCRFRARRILVGCPRTHTVLALAKDEASR